MFETLLIAYAAIALAFALGFTVYFKVQNEPMGATWFTATIWPILIPLLLLVGVGYVSHRLAGGR